MAGWSHSWPFPVGGWVLTFNIHHRTFRKEILLSRFLRRIFSSSISSFKPFFNFLAYLPLFSQRLIFPSLADTWNQPCLCWTLSRLEVPQSVSYCRIRHSFSQALDCRFVSDKFSFCLSVMHFSPPSPPPPSISFLVFPVCLPFFFHLFKNDPHISILLW